MSESTTPPLRWRKASRSGGNGGNCVEVAANDTGVLIRDSKYLRDPSNLVSQQPILALSHEQWELFKLAVAGRRAYTEPHTTIHSSGVASINAQNGTALVFTATEWLAFTLGITDGEFDSVAA